MTQCAQLNLAAGVFRHANEDPRQLALVVDGHKYTYEQLAAAAANMAGWVRSHARRSDRAPRIGILGARSFETYAGILGAAWAGGTYVPLNPKQPPSRLASILLRAGLDGLVADQRGAELLPELAAAAPSHLLLSAGQTIQWPDKNIATWDSLPGASDTPAAVAPQHPAYIMFTSGTTGVPKGVVVSADNVAHFLAFMRELYGISPADRVGQFSETSFDVSVFEMFSAWDGGASLHIVPEAQLMAPASFIRQQALTVWSSVPSVILMLSRLNQLAPGSLPSLRVSYFIGEGLPASSAKAWQAAAPNSVVDNQYGPTEATVACIFQRLTDPSIETPGRGTLAIGNPYPGLDAAIVGPGNVFLDAGETGELALWGPQLAHGYLDDPEQTARRFPTLEHPRRGRSRWYLTGDLAFFDKDGPFHCLGRIDNQVKVMGYRVELEDIEAHLRAVCGSDLVAAIAWPIVDGNAAGIVAFVCGGRLTPAAVRDQLRSRVPAYMVPRKVVAAESLPLSTNGKVDRKALRSLMEVKA